MVDGQLRVFVILSSKYTKIITFLQITPKPENILKRFQNNYKWVISIVYQHSVGERWSSIDARRWLSIVGWVSLLIGDWLMVPIDVFCGYAIGFEWMRVLFSELFMGHDSYCLPWRNWFCMNRRSMLGIRYRSVFIWLHWSMFLSRRWSTPMWTSETHRALYFEISLLKLIHLNHLPEIIIYDGIHVVLQWFISFTLDQGLLPFNNFSCLRHLCLQFPHMCVQRLKLWVQLCVWYHSNYPKVWFYSLK